MKIAVCDDDALLREEVLAITSEYTAQNPTRNISCAAFASAEELLASAEQIGGFDIYILDIVMPGMDGITLGVQLRDHGFVGKIIYLTSSPEYAVDSFQAKPFNYILKPFGKDAFLTALHEAILSVSEKKERSLIVKTKECSIRLTFDSILYAQLNRRTVVYHLTNGKAVESIQIRTPFHEAIQDLLSDRRFVLCGASMAVNLRHITMIENDALVFNDTHRAYLGKKSCREVRSVWYDFCFDGEERT